MSNELLDYMAGMRDRIVHAHDAINLHIVWDSVKQRISIVQPQIPETLLSLSILSPLILN